MNIIIIIIAFSSIIIENAESQLDQSISAAVKNRQKRNPPDVVSNFVFNPTLEQRSLIKTATALWNDKFIKSKMKSTLCLSRADNDRLWEIKEFLNITFQIIDNIELPINLKDDLLYVTSAIGNQLFDFLWEACLAVETLNNRGLLFGAYVDNIRWTDYGKIDMINTIKAVSTSMDNNHLSYQNVDYQIIFMQACKYCATKTIEKIWRKFQSTDQQSIIDIQRYPASEFDKPTILYWINRQSLLNNQMTSAEYNIGYIQQLLQLNKNNLLATNVARLKYFLLQLKMNQREKDEYIVNFLLRQNLLPLQILDDNFVFLMQQLSKEKRAIYFQNNREFSLQHLINSWPWEYLYFEAFEISKENPDGTTTVDYENILKRILEKIYGEYNAFGNYKYSSLWMLAKFWSDYKKHFTDGLINTCWSLSYHKKIKLQFIGIIISHWNVKSINALTNHMEIINGFKEFALNFYETKQYNLLYDIAKKIMKIPEERRLFLQEIPLDEICNYFIINGNRYNEIEKLVEWKYGNDNNLKVNFKKNVNWILIVKNIQTIVSGHGFIIYKIRSLFDWLYIPKKLKDSLYKCIDKYLKGQTVDWQKFYNCIEKVESKSMKCVKRMRLN
ncbi:hypothetical protein HCN44_003759 [Aphidius gifuensis]|uniref:Uncharacterized protein n=1 Tax=Aphidius gifuensis TaxID=684658 RepID=A0A834XJ15_APHGI|nr:hypothetical protein HCN44_003759 [Aphidius gifuensis]